ncbi:MAG: TatD family hydrolase [bacterium]
MKNPLLIDTHAHINFNTYKEDGDDVIQRALDNDVWIINIGAQYSTSKRAVEYAQKYEKGVYSAVGLHPSHICKDNLENDKDAQNENREIEEFDNGKYEELLKNPKTVAVGEIGLEYWDDIKEESKDKQKQVLIDQIELAQQSGRPVILHCRNAYEDLIELLSMFNLGCYQCPHACSPGLKGVMHCFVGRWSQAEKFLEMGFYLSFNGIITYARDYDKVIQNTPLERILLETDCPYLTPVPYRGKRNEPMYIKYIAEKISEIKGISFEKVAKQTTKNARELFGI